MELQELLLELAEFVQQAAPEVWRIVRQQVIADIATRCVWFILCIAGSIAIGKGANGVYKWSKDDDDWDELWQILAFAACAAAGGAVLILNSIIVRLVNPDYYALKLLVELVQ